MKTALKTALKMLTGLAWLARGGRTPRPLVAVLWIPSRAVLLAAAVHHRWAAAKCALAGDEEGRVLHEKHAGRYAAGASAEDSGPANRRDRVIPADVLDRTHRVTWAEMRDGLRWERMKGGRP